MSVSLAGIVMVQIYWIINSVSDKEEQFSFAVRQTLASVSSELEDREVEKFYDVLDQIRDSLGVQPNPRTISELMLIQRNQNFDETSKYSTSLLNENFKLNPQLLDLDIDSVTFNKLLNKKSTLPNRNTSTRKNKTISELSQLDQYARKVDKELISNYNSLLPISQRISKEELREILKEELENRSIEADFEFAVYQDSFATNIKSDYFDFLTDATWSAPIYRFNNLQTEPYILYLNMPDRKKYILSSVAGMALLSLVFTTVIVVAYSNAIKQIFKQRQISQIKTDFINNMTHEFKTPIATINLALDSLRHPKISADPEKVKTYHRMIREENKRMHSQVENVLRISKLEKNDLDIEKERLDMNEVVEDSISHIQLILEEKGGVVKTHLGALRTEVLANESHITNVIVNVLENAIKYTEGAPVIDVFTENIKNKLVIKIRDQGIGMSKQAQRKVFQKFFREHTGDIHNVKGHGLGLAYAKRILDDCDGEIHVESVKGKGSTFSIHLPIIT
ncbi:sensor histidine kinase [Nonlabens dokdonensis]|uniref:histidine kinase n=2 Tax=Nonlabens dokdonensis TaxID=328515 RepID=L7WF11_NONDD|nr:HAMP domain-containing sensor histidine kinase [Nonlabens dokdonensis]AGC78714.1 sensor protein [Nonlabens dokdonensis DSW-6]